MENVTSVEASLNDLPLYDEATAATTTSAKHIDQFIDAYLVGIAEKLAPNLATQSPRPAPIDKRAQPKPDISDISPAKQERLRLNRVWDVLTRYHALREQAVAADTQHSWQSTSVAQSRQHRHSIHQVWLKMSSAQNPGIAV